MVNKKLVPPLVISSVLAIGFYGWDRLQPEPPAPLATGHIALPEISGVAAMGEDLLLVADDSEDKKDDVKKFHMIVRIKEGARGIKAGGDYVVSEKMQVYPALLKKLFPKEKPNEKTLADLEDAALAPNGDVYLITSHSLNKDKERKPGRQHLVRLKIDEFTGEVTSAAIDDGTLLAHLPAEAKELKASTERRPGDADPGFNIEGLAMAPKGDLLVGLRSPLVSGDKGKEAVVLRLSGVDKWINKHGNDLQVTQQGTLDLGGRGIRGMAANSAGGYWIIAGLSADPDTPAPNDWAIYSWDGTGKPRLRWEKGRNSATQELQTPEAICEVPTSNGNGLLLISDDGGDVKSSSYVVLPPEVLGRS